MSNNKHAQVNKFTFVADLISDIAGVNADDSLKEKIHKRVSLLSDGYDARLDTIVNDFRRSDDTELHKIADCITPFLNKGNYSQLFATQDLEFKT